MNDFIKKFNYIFSKKERGQFFKLVILMVIGAALETAVVYLMLPFVTALMDMESSLDSKWIMIIYDVFEMSSTKQLVAFFAILIAIMYITKSVYQYYIYSLKYQYIAKKRSELSGRIFDCIVHKPYSYHVRTNTADIQQITVQDIDRLFNLINAIFIIIANLFTGALILIVLLATDIMLTVAGGALIVVSMLLVNKVIVKKVTRAGQEHRVYYAEQVKWINQTTGGLKGIYANHRQGLFVNEYAQSAKKLAETGAKFQTLSELPKRFVEGTCMSGIFAIVSAFVLFKSDWESMLPIFATFAMAAFRLMPVANAINESMNTIRFHSSSMDSIYDVLADSKIDINKSEKLLREIRPLVYAEDLKKGIFVEHLDFRFDDAEENLYQDFSLKIPAKKSVAFIGTTGAGKTTLADIILGLQIPQKGRILVDDIDILENSEWWADRIGYIPQYIYLCDDTIRANVAFAIAEKDVDDERIIQCLEKAQLKEFVEGLPDGLDTIVGENGVRLSGGQRQRIGIARALYNDPPFLVMDEATSALDKDTESAIITAINQLSGEKTLLIIAHRLTTIENCDIIYKIENGKAIVEKGQVELEKLERIYESWI